MEVELINQFEGLIKPSVCKQPNTCCMVHHLCRYDIAGWCTDRGALVTWNLGRDVINQTKPDTKIDVDNCLMSCAFHPDHPVCGALSCHFINTSYGTKYEYLHPEQLEHRKIAMVQCTAAYAFAFAFEVQPLLNVSAWHAHCCNLDRNPLIFLLSCICCTHAAPYAGPDRRRHL